MLEREMSSGLRYDSLYYGFYFGMPAKDFYDHCWAMNKKGWFRQGATNNTVYAKITELKYPGNINFYPTFYENKIAGMPTTFAYEGWSPWNKKLSADSLKLDVLNLMEKWYGKGFIPIKNPNKFGTTTDAYVKIDGNRRISIYNTNDISVMVDFIDLTKKDQMEELVAAKKRERTQKNE